MEDATRVAFSREAAAAARERPFYDGAGLCSPGRWPPSQRCLPQGGAVGLLRGLLSGSIEHWTKCSGKKVSGILAGLAF